MATKKTYEEESSLNNSPWIEKKVLKCEVCENQNLIYLSFSDESGNPVLDGYFCPVCDKEYFS
jgi:hypothetical protein